MDVGVVSVVVLRSTGLVLDGRRSDVVSVGVVLCSTE